ncbi:MAG: hypothetical protein HY735_19785, partial [Verrucomicrobia bacterium]|nr:hypothetical protein [Verrucomicrobiota bacterium]
ARPVALSVDRTATAQAIWAGGNRAYVAAWGQLKVLDVSQAASPVVLTNLELGNINGIQAVGTLVYVVGGESQAGRLSIYEAAPPSALRRVGTLGFNRLALHLQVAGDYAYLAFADGTLAAVDVRDPSKPIQKGTLTTAGAARRVELAGENAFIADYHGGLQVFNVRDPAEIVQVGSFDTGLTARSVRLSGDKAYVLSADSHPEYSYGARSRLEVLGVSYPTRPALLGTYDSDREIRSMAVAADVAYLGWVRGDGLGLQILDLRNPARPVLLSNTTNSLSGSYSIGVTVSGRYAYLVTPDQGMQIFDVNDPAKPQRLSQEGGTYAEALRVSGAHAYLNSGNGLRVWSVADPKVPVEVGSIDFNQGGIGLGLWVSGDSAYVGQGWNGFSIVDVHSPTNLVAVGGYDSVGEVHDLWTDNNYTFAAEGWEGLEVFDVTNPAQPFPIARSTTLGQARGVQVSGSHAYVVEGGSGLAILSLSETPVTVVADPASLSVALGDSATLSVRAYARGPISYQWYFGESGDVSRPVAGANGASFNTPALTNAAAYWVRVSSGTGVSDSRTARINLVPPVTMELLGLWPGWRRGPATDVQVSGNLAYLTVGNAGFRTYDVADPAAPRWLGTHETKGYANAVALSGKLAFLACGDKGLEVVDISAEATPVKIGSFEPGGNVRSVAVAGSYAYLQGDQLQILDVRDPAQPKSVGSYSLSGSNVKVAGRYAYVVGEQWNSNANVSGGFLAVIDVSSPANPKGIGKYETNGGVKSVAVQSNYAYIVTSPYMYGGGYQIPGGLQVIDVSDPTAPRKAGGVTFDGWPNGLFVSWPNAYVAANESGLIVIDISSPTAPKLLGGSSDTIRSGLAVTISGRMAFVAASDAGLHVFDVATAARPKRLGGVETGGLSEDLAVSGQHAFLADGGGGLRIIDVSNPKSPSLASVYGSNVPRVATSGQFVYLQADSFQVLDVSDPTRPKQIARIEGWADDVFLFGDYAYLTGSPFRMVDVRDPARPYVSSMLDVGLTPRGMSSRGPYAFLGQEWDGMLILDVSAPAQPRPVGVYYADAPVWDVATQGDVACATLRPEAPGLDIIDIRDLQRPFRMAKVPLAVANNVAFMGSYACVTGEGLQVFDLGDPYQPVHVGSHKLSSETRGLQVIGNLVYVAAGDYGLAIYRLTPRLRLDSPVIDGDGLRLSWLGGLGIRLQTATSLSEGDWRDVAGSEGASSIRLPQSNGSAFFRVVKHIGDALPVFAGTMTDRQAFVGGTVSWRADVSGAGPFSYQWQFNGTDLPGGTNAVLALTDVDATQAGSYSVRVSSAFGAVTSPPSLLSVVPFQLDAQPLDQHAYVGETVTFSVVARSSSPISYQWRFNGDVLPGATNASLILSGAKRDRAGFYLVTISNRWGMVSSREARLSFLMVKAWSDQYHSSMVPNSLTNIVAVSAGYQWSLALRSDGTLVAWDSSQANAAPQLRPVPVGLTNVISVSSGFGHSLALRSDGTVVAWGENGEGQVNVPKGLTNVVAVAAGGRHSLALRADGKAVAWGQYYAGGNRVPAWLSNVVSIAAGNVGSVAVLADGTLAKWSAGVTAPNGLSNVVSAACYGNFGLALRADGTVVGWGGVVPKGLSNIVSVAACENYGLAVRADCTVAAWNSYNGDPRSVFPTNVPAGLVDVIAVSGAAGYSLALSGDGLPVVQVPLINPTLSADGFSVSLPTQSGRVFALEYKNSLTDAAWTPLPLVAGTGYERTLTDPTVAGAQRFYRVRRW